MKRVLFLSLALGAGTASAQSSGQWQQLGTYLSRACGAGQQVSGSSQQLQWLCNIASSYTFVNENVLNGDWTTFGNEVMGKYMSQSVDYLGQKLGFEGLNTVTANINESMRGSYSQFRAGLFDAMTGVLRGQAAGYKDDNAGLPVTTPGGLADYATKANPFLTTAQTAGRYQQTVDSFGELLKAAQAKKVVDQSNKSVEAALTPAIDAATNMVGSPIKPGYADQQAQKGESALSMREVLQIQLEMQAEGLKQDASMRITEFQLLTEIAKQQVMTNTQLISKLDDVGSALTDQNNYIKAAMEEAAKDNLEAGSAAARQYAQYAAMFEGLLNPEAVNTSAAKALGGN
jgi:predicted DNA-binding ribbon-helix-helix protein